MRNPRLLTNLILACSILFITCKKNSVEEQYTEIVNPVIPDLTTQVNAAVNGFITDENGNDVADAVVNAGGITVTTDAYGYFKISGAAFPKSAGFARVTKQGYFTAFRTFLPAEGRESFIRLRLVPKISIGSINSGVGGTVTTTNGASITFPADGVVVASGNIAYNGNIHVAAYWLNPADMDITQQNMPGDLRGIDSSGYLKGMTTFGMMAVELTSDAGELLQIAPGKKATLSFPIPASLMAAAPASIPLWYFDESNGLWKQDGCSYKNGGNYVGEVSHFSWWNCDAPNSVVNFKMQLVNVTLMPLANIPVSISRPDIPNSSFTVYSDSSGNINCMLPVNNNMELKIGTECNLSVYDMNISTTNSDLNLGTIKVDNQQYSAAFTGTLNNCAGLPVTNGYVIIAAGGRNQVIEINNGIFNSSSLVCPGTTAAIIAFDRDASQNSIAQNSILTSGINDLGTIQACGNITIETLTYSIDSGPDTTLTEPFYLLSASFDFPNSITNINAFDQINSVTSFNMNFTGPDAAGGTHTITGGVMAGQQSYLASASPVTVTAYGLIGEFIIGSCTVPVTLGGFPHTLNCTFTIKRDS